MKISTERVFIENHFVEVIVKSCGSDGRKRCVWEINDNEIRSKLIDINEGSNGLSNRFGNSQMNYSDLFASFTFNFDCVYSNEIDIERIYSESFEHKTSEFINGKSQMAMVMGNGLGKSRLMIGDKKKPGLLGLTLLSVLSSEEFSGNGIRIGFGGIAVYNSKYIDLISTNLKLNFDPQSQVLSFTHSQESLWKALHFEEINNFDEAIEVFEKAEVTLRGCKKGKGKPHVMYVLAIIYNGKVVSSYVRNLILLKAFFDICGSSNDALVRKEVFSLSNLLSSVSSIQPNSASNILPSHSRSSKLNSLVFALLGNHSKTFLLTFCEEENEFYESLATLKLGNKLKEMRQNWRTKVKSKKNEIVSKSLNLKEIFKANEINIQQNFLQKIKNQQNYKFQIENTNSNHLPKGFPTSFSPSFNLSTDSQSHISISMRSTIDEQINKENGMVNETPDFVRKKNFRDELHDIMNLDFVTEEHNQANNSLNSWNFRREGGIKKTIPLSNLSTTREAQKEIKNYKFLESYLFSENQ